MFADLRTHVLMGKRDLEIANKKQRHVGSRWRQRDMHDRLVTLLAILLVVHGCFAQEDW
jgi:hypothetical protein